MTRLAALFLLAAGAAGAHPHSTVDQQVALSLGLGRAEVVAVIVPSFRDGPAILRHLDADGDGAVSEGEAQALADALLAGLSLVVDGEAVALGGAVAAVAPPEAVRAGTGPIRVRASAPLALSPGGGHVVAFEVAFDAFAPDWFVQPFYGRDLLGAFGTPTLERRADGAGVVVEMGP